MWRLWLGDVRASSQETAIVFGNDQSTVISVEQLLKGGFARLKLDGGYREVAKLTVHRNVFEGFFYVTNISIL